MPGLGSPLLRSQAQASRQGRSSRSPRDPVPLTCWRWAWPSTYFPGGLVWAGTGPDAARTAAGRFAVRQEKSVDSTQFRPSTLPRRMFPSMPVLAFYSLSSSFRCLCDGMGGGGGDGGRDGRRQAVGV